MTDVYMGTIATYGFQFAPRNWALCSNQLIAISQNTALFALLGTTYGGDGQVTFALPDLRSRLMVGQANNGSYVMGQVQGTENTTLINPNLPQHNHTLTATTVAATLTTPDATSLLAPPAGEDANLGTVTVKMYQPAGGALTPFSPLSVGLTGNNLPTPILQPLLCINASIALYGIFPSRN